MEIGRCQGCKQVVYDVNNITDEIKQKMKNYDLRVVPTTIIDGEIRVVGIPDIHRQSHIIQQLGRKLMKL